MGEDKKHRAALNEVVPSGYKEAFFTVRISNWQAQGPRGFLDPPSLEVLKDLTRQRPEQPGLTSWLTLL